VPNTLEARQRAIAEAFRAVALESRVATLSAQLNDVQSRLDAVETTLLESAWERPVAGEDGPAIEDGPATEDERADVPKLPLDTGRMSSTAARALFGQ
jgi:hypothetical protein